MNDSIMVAKNVTRKFRTGAEIVYALHGVSIDIPRGRLTILRGRSGSGKTTLLNILSGLDKPTAGEVYFNGRRTSDFSEYRKDRLRARKMGFVFQSVALMPDMNAYENIEYGLRISGGFSSKSRESIKESLELVGLSKRAHHLAQELSGGEQQRVAIARSFAHEPEILFADEPTAELDTAMSIQIVDIFKKLITEKNLSVVMTTHDPNMLELADLVYTLSDGEIVDDD